jgi:Gluconate 2-dehydrogenase subunit 3
MDRREALKNISILLGGSVIGADSFLRGTLQAFDGLEDAPAIGLFSKKQVKIFDEIADIILPRTATPGAKDAKTVGAFMARFISDCYESRDQQVAVTGLQKLQDECKKRYGKAFMKTTAAQKLDYFSELDAEQKAYTKAKKAEDPPHWFRIFWELSLFGFFTSEVGSSQVLRWIPNPGRYETIDYKKGDRAWGG